MTARKTFNVEAFRKECNRRLALEPNRLSTDERRAICSLVEHVLHESGNYSGFGDKYWLDEGGYEAWKAAGEPEDRTKSQFFYAARDGKDDYRRVYY